jgi:Anti-sigma-K factor rskA, C-terminal
VQHLDPDDLALLALGENLGDAVDAHIDTCGTCRDEVESFRLTVGLAELSNYGEDAPQPGEHVWAAIAAELGLRGTRSGTATLTSRTGESDGISDLPTPVLSAEPGPGSAPATSGSSSGLNGAARPDLRSVAGTGTDLPPADTPASKPRRWSRWVAPLAAAVIGIAVGAGAVILTQDRSNGVTVEATAPLTPVPTGPLAGQTGTLGKAQLVAAPTGQEVTVNAADLPPASNSSYEVWLFGDNGKMVSLGTLDDGNGTFTVPADISTREYRTVDVSDEPPDGNPAHSGISLIRGAFS